MIVLFSELSQGINKMHTQYIKVCVRNNATKWWFCLLVPGWPDGLLKGFISNKSSLGSDDIYHSVP